MKNRKQKPMKTTTIRARLSRKGRVAGYIDEYTGEEYGFPVIVGRKRNPYGNGWIMNSQEALDRIAEDKELNGYTLRVFIKVCARVDFENWVHLPLKDLAEELRIHKPDVSRSIRQLVEKGILIRSEKIGRSYAYRLNPNFGWKGKVHHLEEYRHQKHKAHVQDTKKRNAATISEESELLDFLKSHHISMDDLKSYMATVKPEPT